MPGAPAATETTLKLLTFNILTAGNPVTEIGRTSPIYQKPRHADIAAVTIQSGADIVGAPEPNSLTPDPILAVLQANNPARQKRGSLYAKFPIEEDPHNPGDTSTHLVRTGPEQFMICHMAYWTPSNCYRPPPSTTSASTPQEPTPRPAPPHPMFRPHPPTVPRSAALLVARQQRHRLPGVVRHFPILRCRR